MSDEPWKFFAYLDTFKIVATSPGDNELKQSNTNDSKSYTRV